MHDVVDEILQLLFAERPRRPIADGLRLCKPNADEIANEIGERYLHAVSEKRRRYLRIEEFRRHASEPFGEDLEVALQCVADDGNAFERRDERLQIDSRRERVDDRRISRQRELQYHQARRVTAFGMKFRVEPHALARLKARAKSGDARGVGDKVVGHGVAIGEGEGSDGRGVGRTRRK